jgi:hypothetical protein
MACFIRSQDQTEFINIDKFLDISTFPDNNKEKVILAGFIPGKIDPCKIGEFENQEEAFTWFKSALEGHI